MANVVITGANRGIGLELVKLFQGRGDHVVALCRKPTPALRETGAEIVEGIDVTADDTTALTTGIGERPVDVLINNAGIMRFESLETVDLDAARAQFETNALGPLRVTTALLGHLGQGSKVAIVTSRMGSIGDNGSGGGYGYRMSKAAVNAAGVSLARDLAPKGIAVSLLHPGSVKTELTNNAGMIPPEEAAAGIAARIDELTVETSGRFLHQNGTELPW